MSSTRSVCGVGKRHDCPQAEAGDPVLPYRVPWGSGLVLIIHKA